MTDRELMQQALDALEGYARNCRCEGGGAPCDAAEALRARLAGWEKLNMNDYKEGDLGIGTVKWDASAPLVVHPHPAFQATQPQQHSEQWWRHEVSNAWAEGYEKGRASVKQPEQEPVAWITDGGKGELWWHQSVKFDDDGNLIGENPDDIPLYTAPPQREWQGLTDEEMFSLWVRCPAETEDRFAFARAIEQALKEKNT